MNSPLALDFNVKTIHLYLNLKNKVSMDNFVFWFICFVLSWPGGRWMLDGYTLFSPFKFKLDKSLNL